MSFWGPLGLSFLVYLIPLLTAHWINPLGLTLGAEAMADRELPWKAVDFGMALGVQTLAFCLAKVVWPRGKGAVMGAYLLAAVPATMLVNYLYLAGIPALFLIERETTPDVATWAEECVVAGYALDQVRAGVSQRLERRGEAVIRKDNGGSYAILTVPGCGAEPVAIPLLPIAPGVQQALPDGGLVYVTHERFAQGRKFWLLPRGAKDAQQIAPPIEAAEDASPVVSDDGKWAAWLVRDAERVQSLLIQPLGAGTPVRYTHDLLQRATVVVVELDMEKREVVISRDLSTFVRLRLDGGVVWGPLAPGDTAAQTDTFRYVDGQWLGWDAYVENKRYRLVWSAQGGQGRHEISKGSSITSAALDPEGRYVAASTTTSLNIGSIQDTLRVLRTRDGGAAFRKTVPAYARSEVKFLGKDYFAYTDFDGTASRIRVLRVP